jgi:hypothetical protein
MGEILKMEILKTTMRRHPLLIAFFFLFKKKKKKKIDTWKRDGRGTDERRMCRSSQRDDGTRNTPHRL